MTILFLLLLVTGAAALVRYVRHDRFTGPSDDTERLVVPAAGTRHFVASLR
ncbi:MAG TPA: hypothetical protein VD859_11225 [Nocardioides sp.]|nr:hypothetical protein [Nocardioides sp.]